MIRMFICAGDLRKRTTVGISRRSKRVFDVGGYLSDTQVLKRAIDMTDDELAAIVGRAKLTVV